MKQDEVQTYDLKEILIRWNPWWLTPEVPGNKKQIPRIELLERVTKLLEAKESIVLTGARRSGKSTLMYQIVDKLIKTVKAKNILYFNFDEPLKEKTSDMLEKIFRTFLEINNPKGRKFIFFDEIQTISGWESWIKKYYDLYGKEVKFVLTGSNSSMLSKDLLKLLTGRMFAKSVFPLSFREFLKFKNVEIKDDVLQKEEIKHHFSEYLSKGGFPEVVLEEDEEVNKQRLRDYSDGILLRDIIVSKAVRETAKLTELAYFCITNISTEFSYNKLSKSTGITINSLKEYLSFLEDAYLVFQLRYFSYSVKESIMIQKPRKIYCIDNGLRNAVGFKFSKDESKLAENLVFLEFKRANREIYYWKEKGEVDFVVKNDDQSLTAINVFYSDRIHEREINSLLEFKERFKKTKELIILTKDSEMQKQGIKFIPLWKWLLQQHQQKAR